MGEEFYAVIKLVSGEEILSLVMVDDSGDEPIMVLQNPVVMKTFHNHQGVHIKVKPWMEMTEDDFYFITLDKIITCTETSNDKLINIYNRFLEEEDNGDIDVYTKSGQVKPDERMGYISSVMEARRMLENIYRDLSVEDNKDTQS